MIERTTKTWKTEKKLWKSRLRSISPFGEATIMDCAPAIWEAVKLGYKITRAARVCKCSLSRVRYSQMETKWRDMDAKRQSMTYDEFKRYLEDCSVEDEDIFHFVEGVEKAKAEFVGACLKRIQQSAIGGKEYVEAKIEYGRDKNGKRTFLKDTVTKKVERANPQMDVWMLERMYPNEFGPRQISTDDSASRLADAIDTLIKVRD